MSGFSETKPKRTIKKYCVFGGLHGGFFRNLFFGSPCIIFAEKNAMTNQLYIKAEAAESYADAYATYGIAMGEGFISALDGVPPLKDYISFSSRVLDGKEIRATSVVDARDLTLNFYVSADTPEAYRLRKDAFLAFLKNNPRISLQVPSVFGDNWAIHLVYLGKSVTYGESFDHKRGTLAMKFTEPDPTNRTTGEVEDIAYLTSDDYAEKLTDGTNFLIP